MDLAHRVVDDRHLQRGAQLVAQRSGDRVVAPWPVETHGQHVAVSVDAHHRALVVGELRLDTGPPPGELRTALEHRVDRRLGGQREVDAQRRRRPQQHRQARRGDRVAVDALDDGRDVIGVDHEVGVVGSRAAELVADRAHHDGE
jgi:hypothetical protein